MKADDYTFSLYAEKKYGVKGSCSMHLTKNFIKLLIYLVYENAGYLENSAKNYILDEQSMIGVPKDTINELKHFEWDDVSLRQLIDAISPELELENIPHKEKIVILYHAAKALSYYESDKVSLSSIKKIAQKLHLNAFELLAIQKLIDNEKKVASERKKIFHENMAS